MRNSPRYKKLIFASTYTIYGDAQIVPTPEKYVPLSPISLYGASNLACEALICGCSDMFNMSSTVFRWANVVGPEST